MFLQFLLPWLGLSLGWQWWRMESVSAVSCCVCECVCVCEWVCVWVTACLFVCKSRPKCVMLQLTEIVGEQPRYHWDGTADWHLLLIRKSLNYWPACGSASAILRCLWGWRLCTMFVKPWWCYFQSWQTHKGNMVVKFFKCLLFFYSFENLFKPFKPTVVGERHQITFLSSHKKWIGSYHALAFVLCTQQTLLKPSVCSNHQPLSGKDCSSYRSYGRSGCTSTWVRGIRWYSMMWSVSVTDKGNSMHPTWIRNVSSPSWRPFHNKVFNTFQRESSGF